MGTENKAVLISIKPKWCELILREKKTVEVRKTRPKLETPFKCYIYQTKGKERLIDIMKGSDNCYGETYHGKPVFIKMRENSGYAGLFGREQKVIGEFVCDVIGLTAYTIDGYADIIDCKFSCMSPSDFLEYGKGGVLYSWHISDLKIYDKPRELSEFGLTRPPQSWCYVEEVKK